MSRDERGHRRCPRCGAAEWERGTEHVLVAPVTGEAVTFATSDDGERTWQCAGCHIDAPAPGFIEELLSEVGPAGG